MRQIGLFGGSFDPIHIGHIALAKDAIEQLELDEFAFIPTKNNPWKDTQCASANQRIDMICIAIRNCERMSIDEIEVKSSNNDKNYTIETLRLLLKEHTDVRYFYLMGMDQVISFNKWKCAEEISQLVQLVAFNRGGYPNDHENIEKYHFIKLENTQITASSTQIRSGQLNILDSEVLRYISKNGLYLDTMIKNRMSKKRYDHTLSVAKLTKEFAYNNTLDSNKGYIAGIMHDVAKEMDKDVAYRLMQEYFPSHINMPRQIWHQWLSSYVAKNEFLIEDEEILKAIEDHTTGSTTMNGIGKCLYCADKLDPLRGYDSSQDIDICNMDINEGFRKSLQSFYDFSIKNHKNIDKCFYEVYDKYCKGEIKK